MGEKDRKTKKFRGDLEGLEWTIPAEPDDNELEPWLDVEKIDIIGHDESLLTVTSAEVEGHGPSHRLDLIKQSHSLLCQFTHKELKLLLNLKRNTSPKAWTLREDLVVLTLNLSNREIAEILTDRNKEAVKKRLQLLKSKGLAKRQPEPAPNDTRPAQT